MERVDLLMSHYVCTDSHIVRRGGGEQNLVALVSFFPFAFFFSDVYPGRSAVFPDEAALHLSAPRVTHTQKKETDGFSEAKNPFSCRSRLGGEYFGHRY